MDEKRIYNSGVHLITINDYHASAGLSRSALMQFKRSPYHYFNSYHIDTDVNSDSNNEALVFGNLLHCLVLEPEKFEEDYIIRPQIDRRTHAGKDAYFQFQSITAGRNIVTQEQVEQAVNMSQLINANNLCMDLLANCKIEQSIYFNHSPTGIQCKVRPDAWNGGLVVDLKSCQNACYTAFQRSSVNYCYFLQAGMIAIALNSIGLELEKFVFLAVEKEKPHAIGLYVVDQEALLWGVNQFDNLMTAYALCLEKNYWPDYGLQILTVPNWANLAEVM